jgi:hypothetical protein
LTVGWWFKIGKMNLINPLHFSETLAGVLRWLESIRVEESATIKIFLSLL